ncbi:MAG: phosphoribosylformylglycinamidine cyclo-ligase [Lachnospiraceae bacterium]|nr:phosphoribosylformylglycinamidine cyclo-ligase [Lachnospiraceae bacterium]
MDYKQSGVNLEAGYESVRLIKGSVERTRRPEVLGGLGGFSGAFLGKALKGMESPVLLSGTDGVGTKLKLAYILDKHDTIGIDCVAMCVNDVACAGGEPLFFLDYIACGKNEPQKIAEIVKGVAEGCVQAGAALIGGETAEHPGMMPEDEYDLAGFTVGVCEEKDLITGKEIKAGDVLVGLLSSGVHSNGFSLIRRIFSMDVKILGRKVGELGTTLGDALLTPTKIYVRALRAIKKAGIKLLGLSHITGGGFYENIPRMLPEGLYAEVDAKSYEMPPIFPLIQREGRVEWKEMFSTYNCGIGLVAAVREEDCDRLIREAQDAGERAFVIGRVKAGERRAEVLF